LYVLTKKKKLYLDARNVDGNAMEQSARKMYSQPQVRMYKTVLPLLIFNVNQFVVKYKFDGGYLSVRSDLSCCCPYKNRASV
jgi:hypothetical protein